MHRVLRGIGSLPSNEDVVTNGRMEFVTGFLKGDGARGRPVGVAVDKAGALIVADDVGNTVWRVTHN